MLRPATALFLLLALACAGLDDTGGAEMTWGDDDACYTCAEYTLSCDGVDCDNVDDESSYTDGDFKALSCTWYCSTYEGVDRQYVDLTFESWGGACFELASEYVSDGVCY